MYETFPKMSTLTLSSYYFIFRRRRALTVATCCVATGATRPGGSGGLSAASASSTGAATSSARSVCGTFRSQPVTKPAYRSQPATEPVTPRCNDQYLLRVFIYCTNQILPRAPSRHSSS